MRQLIKQGKKLRIVWGDDGSGTFHGRDFFKSLSKTDQAKFVPLFERLADTGQIANKEKFVKESSEIFALKIHKQRLYGFRDGSDFVVISGMTKKFNKGKRLARAIERAESLMERHLKETE